jgi:toxin ParE1/3/4
MKVIWSRRAIRHLVFLREYIAKDSEQNAALVAKRILKAVDLLQTHPEIGRPGRVVGTRELVVADTPYIIPLPGPPRTVGIDCRFPWAAKVAGKTVAADLFFDADYLAIFTGSCSSTVAPGLQSTRYMVWGSGSSAVNWPSRVPAFFSAIV